jgi:hypothetical protein
MQKFLRLSVGLSDNQTTMVAAASLIFALFLQPLYGAISDRIGRKWLLIFFGVCGTLFTIPLLSALIETKTAFGAFLLIAAAWLIGGEGRAIPDECARDRRGPSLRADGLDLRRHRRHYRPLVQNLGARKLVRLLPYHHHRAFPHRLRDHARHEKTLCDPAPRIARRPATRRHPSGAAEAPFPATVFPDLDHFLPGL